MMEKILMDILYQEPGMSILSKLWLLSFPTDKDMLPILMMELLEVLGQGASQQW